jgi:MFS transporter, DHA1 family, inner membrane transport protein
MAGGAVVSIRNARPDRRMALVFLLGTALGSVLVATRLSVATTLAGAALIGAFLAPLVTFYSLTLDGLAPAARRAEIFTLLRTANAVGIIVLSALLALGGLPVALPAAALGIAAAALVVAAMLARGRRAGRDGEAPEA